MNSNIADRDFAWVYNRHWGPYASQALSIIDELILDDTKNGARILDLCCGTGQLSAELGKLGYSVTGIDISEEMILFARHNSPETEFFVGDVRQFHLPEIFSCAISTYDSLNFIMNTAELHKVFQNVYSSLVHGGRFLFDLNTEYGYLFHWEDGILTFVEDDHACIVQSTYDSHHETAQLDTATFRLTDGWQRTDLTFHQKFYTEPDVRTMLESAGFVDTATYGYDDENGLSELNNESERMYFVCRKP